MSDRDFTYKNSGVNSRGNHYCSRDYGNGATAYHYSNWMDPTTTRTPTVASTTTTARAAGPTLRRAASSTRATAPTHPAKVPARSAPTTRSSNSSSGSNAGSGSGSDSGSSGYGSATSGHFGGSFVDISFSSRTRSFSSGTMSFSSTDVSASYRYSSVSGGSHDGLGKEESSREQSATIEAHLGSIRLMSADGETWLPSVRSAKE
ncbi:hypothetical protein VTK56DRAFT_891 [Thermocarpiscus australiensis]